MHKKGDFVKVGCGKSKCWKVESEDKSEGARGGWLGLEVLT